MHGSQFPALEIKETAVWEQKGARSDLTPVWDLESSPRLYITDLQNPEAFHRRLVDWIMNQK